MSIRVLQFRARPRTSRSWAVIAVLGAGLVAGCAGEFAQRPGAAQDPVSFLSGRDTGVDQGEQALAAGLYEEARAHFTRAMELEPTSRRAKLGLGELDLAQGRYREALSRFEDAQSDPALRPRALQGRGIALLNLKNRDVACPLLLEATGADDTLWRAWNALAHCRDLQEDWAGSEKSYQKALALQPDSALVRNNYGFSLLLQKRYPEAIAQFTSALRADPKLEAAKANIRLALAAQGRYNDALLDVRPDELATALNNAGFVAMLRGDYAAAEAYFSRAMESSPSYNEAASRNLSYLKALKAPQDNVSAPSAGK